MIASRFKQVTHAGIEPEPYSTVTFEVWAPEQNVFGHVEYWSCDKAALILQQEELFSQAELTADLALVIKIIPAASMMIICPYFR